MPRSAASSLVLWFALCLVAACSGGGGGGTATPSAATPGSVAVVLDTAAGADVLVQAQVAAVVFGRADGTYTTNVLPAPALVTFVDPSGEASGLRLPSVPGGDYASLRFVLVPGSCAAFGYDGSVTPLQTPLAVEVPIADGFTHDARSAAWLAIGHDETFAPASTGVGLPWSPNLSARVDGTDQQLLEVRLLVVQGDAVTGGLEAADGAPLQVEFAPACSFAIEGVADGAERTAFVAACDRDSELRLSGELRRDGTFRAARARVARIGDGPRLLGRILELRPATTSFVLRVQAEVRRGERRLLAAPLDVLVLAGNARIHRPNHAPLAFGDLAVGDLAKVKVRSRAPGTNGLTELTAAEIEVPTAGGEPCAPQWQGMVQSVDPIARTIVVEPRNGDPIVVGGVAVPLATVFVAPGTPIERRERRGGGRIAIGLADIESGSDRIWWRGVVSGPARVDASSVRVRAD
ncbi:MAG: hypothetical protein JNK15_18815 [Planctomycetes bacterium]|nr:hypothetical protein [Planctomycetota bacterium]